MAHRRVGDAGADFNFLRRHRDGAGQNIEFAPDHVRIADPKALIAELLGGAREFHCFAGIVGTVHAYAKFYLLHLLPSVRLVLRRTAQP